MADSALNSSTEVAAQAVHVRANLKTWEKAFASANGGKKAGRDDIKQNPDIAAKYKEYSRLKALEASLTRRENRRQETESHSKKRKHASPPGSEGTYTQTTPRKSSKGLFATPSNNRTKIHPAQLDPYDSPSTLRRLFSPSTHQTAASPLKAAIGPTPQRDGKTLGLFDMLSESGGSGGTPSVKRQTSNLAAGFRTPSKRRPVATIPEDPEEEPQQETPRLARTPASETKQFYLANLFATPTTMRYAALVEAEDNAEAQSGTLHPAQISPQPAHSGTPSFLRRSNSGRYPPPGASNGGQGLSPIVSRKPQQFASKGLSHLVQGLRDMEEDRMEDDWEVMREMEEEAEAEEMAKNQEEDSQDPDVNRKYKKKGQKRTTRRVVMRPVINQPKPKQTPAPTEEDEFSDSDDELAAVPETQFAPGVNDANDGWDDVPSDIERAEEGAAAPNMSEPEQDTDAEFDPDSDDDPGFGGRPKPVARTKSFSERIKEAVSSSAAAKPKEPASLDKPPKTAAPEGKKPYARKVNPQAHANYRSLKIGNRGGSRGRGGRFRRR
ncbi:hypothetical protein N7508_005176 [Penicillium antarcticum]|uniref:uncharacterized protein n=1 Tax=Penicillium antarcticum TaxID=416450 RepID=UPI00239C56A1|nr:uncharacterized protein N7508_005176 [Penicillium antarcticum]KAJ5306161.1 hypothetical protein N7508_005176 [Penicillium antarcticum]